MSRDEGIEMVKKYDHVRPTEDLKRWFEYTNVSEDEFNQHSDKFRDSRKWFIKKNKWFKKNLWGGESEYGEVFLNNSLKKKYLR